MPCFITHARLTKPGIVGPDRRVLITAAMIETTTALEMNQSVSIPPLLLDQRLRSVRYVRAHVQTAVRCMPRYQSGLASGGRHLTGRDVPKGRAGGRRGADGEADGGASDGDGGFAMRVSVSSNT